MVNKIVKEAMFNTGVPQWKIANELRIHENTLSRKLRIELNPDEREEILQIIERIKDQ